jgi:TPR repeat protein
MLSVERRQIRPAGYFPAIDQPPPSTEIWVITEETGWQAPKRLQLMAAMAAMGNAKSRYQLGVALIGEPDPVARAEGVRWLQLAAAAGNTDAKILIEAAGDDARSDRDRDLDRVHRHVTAGNSRGR